MRQIERSTSFTRDYKRLMSGRHARRIVRDLALVIDALASDEQLPGKFRDHSLVGNWTGFRNCHLAFDLVLIYHYPDNETLRLVRLGSHAQIGIT